METKITQTTLQFTISPYGWKLQTYVLLVSLFIWYGFSSWFYFTSSAPFLFYLLFLVSGLIPLALFLYKVTSKTMVFMDKDKTEVTWNFLYLKYTKHRQTKDLQEIKEVVLYTRNYQAVYGIGLVFKDEKIVKFGSRLSKNEKMELIQSIKNFKENNT